MSPAIYFSREITAPDLDIQLPETKTSDSLVLYEETATLWAWAWPIAMGWHCDIEWLFSPVVGQTWPGDLWGIDSSGGLVIVETKLANAPQDPMRDFLQYAERTPVHGLNPLFDVHLLRKRWLHRWEMELTFIQNYLSSFRQTYPLKGTFPGVVPYSRKRLLVRRWIDIYESVIVPRLKAPSYFSKIDAWLNLRSGSRIHQVDYIGLFAAEDGEVARLSRKGLQHSKELQNEVGQDRIHWRTFLARRISDSSVMIVAKRPSLHDA